MYFVDKYCIWHPVCASTVLGTRKWVVTEWLCLQGVFGLEGKTHQICSVASVKKGKDNSGHVMRETRLSSESVESPAVEGGREDMWRLLLSKDSESTSGNWRPLIVFEAWEGGKCGKKWAAVGSRRVLETMVKILSFTSGLVGRSYWKILNKRMIYYICIFRRWVSP